MGTIGSLEAILASRSMDLHNLQESLAMTRGKLEGLESTMADIQDLTEKLGAIVSPEASVQLKCVLQELVSKNSALKAAAHVQEAQVER